MFPFGAAAPVSEEKDRIGLLIYLFLVLIMAKDQPLLSGVLQTGFVNHVGTTIHVIFELPFFRLCNRGILFSLYIKISIPYFMPCKFFVLDCIFTISCGQRISEFFWFVFLIANWFPLGGKWWCRNMINKTQS